MRDFVYMEGKLAMMATGSDTDMLKSDVTR